MQLTKTEEDVFLFFLWAEKLMLRRLKQPCVSEQKVERRCTSLGRANTVGPSHQTGMGKIDFLKAQRRAGWRVSRPSLTPQQM